MLKAKNLLLIAIMLFITQLSIGQKQTITGTITDANTGLPLTGASVKVKSGTTGVTSTEKGTFSLEVPANTVLVISSIGYADQSFNIGSNTAVNIKMQPSVTDLTQVIMIGTRAPGRIKTESPVPIDVIRINQVGMPTGRMDLTSILNVSAPSFNYNKQSGADGADHIDIGTLRGLGADHTLVLVNGKRRHPTAFVALFGTRGRAGSGVDMNGFPQASVDRIEILRDGASAQYGSDAIAGVINIILKKDVKHLSANVGWAGYYDTKFNARDHNANNDYYAGKAIDGNTFNANLNHGFGLGNNGGYFNYSLDYRTQGKTYRQAKVSDDLSDKDALPDVNLWRRGFGDGSITTKGVMYNMEVPLSAAKKASFYSFGSYNYKSSDAYAYTRQWNRRPDRFPVDAGGNLIMVPSIMRTTKDGDVIYYNPHIQTNIKDAAFAAGFKGETAGGWSWDLSNNTGYNDFHYYGDKTFNASIIGAATPNSFDDGGFNLLQNTTNLDFSKGLDVAAGLNLGLGAEFRYEKYKIYAGEEGSYASFHPNELFYPSAGESLVPASGSQGFPGFSPNDVVSASRSNIGVYADAELNVTKQWLIDAAVRFENYSDFGSVFTGKLATRIKVADNFNIRGSFSTGFRAPSLAQIHFSNTLTSFSGGSLVQSLIAPNTSAISKAAGIPDLKEETSVNSSLGFTWKPAKNFTVTVDGYLVKMKDRVVLSGLFSKDDPTLDPSFTSQFPADVSTAQFFANAVNTTNYGVDIVLDYTKKWSNKTFKFLLTGNFQHVNIDKVNVPSKLNDIPLHRKTFYSDREEYFLKASAPNRKLALVADYTVGNWSFRTQLTSFGKILLTGFGDGESPEGDNPNYSGINPQVPADDGSGYVPEIFNYSGKVTTDVSVSYKFSKKVTLFVGADNIFNVHPNLGVNPKAKWWYGDNESGGPWDSVQMGFNGRRLFTKLAFNF
jgi:iron complex outermembrane recepter protein